MKLKRCVACGTNKPRAEFARQASGRLYRNCGSCHTPHTQAAHTRAYYKSAEYKRVARQQHADRDGRSFRPGMPGRAPGYAKPETPATLARRAWVQWIARAPAAWLHSYRAARSNARRIAACESARRYHAANPGKSRERVKRYKNANPTIVARAGLLRWKRASEQSDGTVTAGQVSRILRSKRRCPYCLTAISPDSAQLDHIIPLAGGGLHGIINLTPSCAPCNLRKSDRTFAEWVAMLDGKARASAVALYEARYGPLAQGVLL